MIQKILSVCFYIMVISILAGYKASRAAKNFLWTVTIVIGAALLRDYLKSGEQGAAVRQAKSIVRALPRTRLAAATVSGQQAYRYEASTARVKIATQVPFSTTSSLPLTRPTLTCEK